MDKEKKKAYMREYMKKRYEKVKAQKVVQTNEVKLEVTNSQIEVLEKQLKELEVKQVVTPLTDVELKLMKRLDNLKYTYPYLNSYEAKELRELEDRFKNSK